MQTRHLIRIRLTVVFALTSVLWLLPAAPAQHASNGAVPAQSAGWLSYAHDAHHSGVSSRAAQSMKKIHWSVPVDLSPHQELGIVAHHYGSPLITAANTTIVPVKTGGNSFRVEARRGLDGSLLWSQTTDYVAPDTGFTPGMYPVLDHKWLIIPGGGGTILLRGTPDQPSGKLSRLAFYGIDNYKADPQAYQQNVQISTPITADSKGNIYFGFLVTGPTPIGLKSGLARIGVDRKGSWIAAVSATNDSSLTQVNTSCGPALSPDESTVYVGLTNPDIGYGDLIAVNSQTLKTTGFVRLKDPSSGDDAYIFASSSASPTVGPDGDVYFGVIENPFPDHNDRGWLLHFDGTLKQSKIPGSFGWDDTASIVDASLVSSYHGTSKYLLMTKYNNYAGIGTGDGVNKLAVLDPNDTEPDPVLPGTTVMKEVLTIKGVTRDPNFPQFPNAVREWCINTAAVDPVTKSILANSEDGKLYRWDLTTNSFAQRITLTGGVGEAYTPTVIGSDGTAYAINDAVLFAIGK